MGARGGRGVVGSVGARHGAHVLGRGRNPARASDRRDVSRGAARRRAGGGVERRPRALAPDAGADGALPVGLTRRAYPAATGYAASVVTWRPLWDFDLLDPGGNPIDLWRTLVSHGIASLPPMRLDEDARTLEVTLRGDGASPRTVRVLEVSRGSGAKRASTPEPPLSRGSGAKRASTPEPPLSRGSGAKRASTPEPPLSRGSGAKRASTPEPPLSRGFGAKRASTPEPPPSGRGRVEVAGRAPGRRATEAHVATLRYMLRLDEDLSAFYATAARDSRLAWVTRGAGRMLRSPTVFEDVVKTLCTTNCSWSATERMVAAIVEHLGEPAAGAAPTGAAGRAFPTPEAMAGASLSFYKDVARAGYRGPYLLSLARSVADGTVH